MYILDIAHKAILWEWYAYKEAKDGPFFHIKICSIFKFRLVFLLVCVIMLAKECRLIWTGKGEEHEYRWCKCVQQD